MGYHDPVHGHPPERRVEREIIVAHDRGSGGPALAVGLVVAILLLALIGLVVARSALSFDIPSEIDIEFDRGRGGVEEGGAEGVGGDEEGGSS